MILKTPESLDWGLQISWCLPGGPDGEESAHSEGDLGQSLGLEDPLEEVWHPPQHSCLENPTDRGAWQTQSMGSQSIGHNWAMTLLLPDPLK